MRFILIMIIASFLQSSFLPINLCLILLLCRNSLVDDSYNFTSAFIGGLFLSFLMSLNLGIYPILFLISVYLMKLFKSFPFSVNPITNFIFAASFLLVFNQVESLIFGQSLNLAKITWEIVLFIPIFAAYYFWEDRFVVPGKKSLVLKKSLK